MGDSDEENRALPPPAPDEDEYDEDSGSSAADDPTDVWDEEKLRAVGLGSVLDGAASKPATKSTGPREDSIEIALPSDPPGAPRAATARPAPRRGMSWTATIAVALVAAVAVYLAIRFFR